MFAAPDRPVSFEGRGAGGGGAGGRGERGQGEESLITSSRTTILRFTSHETNNYVFTLYKLEVVQNVTSKSPN